MELDEYEKAFARTAYHRAMATEHDSNWEPGVYAAVSAVLEMRDRGHEALRKAAQDVVDEWGLVQNYYRPRFDEAVKALQAALTTAAPETPTEPQLGTCDFSDVLHDLRGCKASLHRNWKHQAAQPPVHSRQSATMDDEVRHAPTTEPKELSPEEREVVENFEQVVQREVIDPCVQKRKDAIWGRSAQSPADGQLVERMCEAYTRKVCGSIPSCGFSDALKDGMTAAMQVCLSSRDKEWSGWGIVEIAVRNPSVAEYTKHWEDRVKVAEDQLKSLTENADFLRKSVGACHMMISRNDLEELRQDEWDATHLPPRLYKFISELKGDLVALPDVEKAIGDLARACPDDNSMTAGGYRVALDDLRARLKPESAWQERVTVSATNGHWLVYQDGLEVFHLDKGSYTKLDAERYATGLRAELAEKGKAE